MISACCCVQDAYEFRPDVYSDDVRTARVEHICGECSEAIKPGQRYEDFRGCWEGEWERHKTCAPCLGIRNDFFECGWNFGRIRHDFRECYGFDYVTGEVFWEEDE